MNKIKKLFLSLTLFERLLWSISVSSVIISFFAFGSDNAFTLIASVIGLTALVFCAKGHPVGQVLIIAFSVFYGIVSFGQRYYGEMITYLGMSTPMAVMALVSWLRNTVGDSQEVKVNKLTKKHITVVFLLSFLVSVGFYFILEALGNASLITSTVSVFTSFLAASLTFLRSPFYALAYASNDIVLIVLWIIASVKDISGIPMVICFTMFLINDMYGFINWQRMKKRQQLFFDEDL
ncbi:MAG: nicotinamide mononucleotide transporter [Clostridia bacterium]|nr:nicotinamide mononucleotide transporter [Clostridia bacterium]